MDWGLDLDDLCKKGGNRASGEGNAQARSRGAYELTSASSKRHTVSPRVQDIAKAYRLGQTPLGVQSRQAAKLNGLHCAHTSPAFQQLLDMDGR